MLRRKMMTLTLDTKLKLPSGYEIPQLGFGVGSLPLITLAHRLANLLFPGLANVLSFLSPPPPYPF
jgi:hypothetical protein